jgi:hypothetical protein
MHASIKLDPRLDRRTIAQVLKTQGRVHIPDVLLRASADTVLAQLHTQTPWQLSLNVDERHLDLAHHQLMLMPPEQRETMARRMIEQSKHGFQNAFEAGERAHPLLAMHEF